MRIKLVEFTEKFLKNSFLWLNDEEISQMTNTPPFNEKDQKIWFENLQFKSDYLIWGVDTEDIPIGACGIKNITDLEAEYWGYIGEKKYWGNGLGSEMIFLIENKARDHGIKSLYLKVICENFRAISLYKKQGYVIEKKLDRIILMRKIL